MKVMLFFKIILLRVACGANLVDETLQLAQQWLNRIVNFVAQNSPENDTGIHRYTEFE